MVMAKLCDAKRGSTRTGGQQAFAALAEEQGIDELGFSTSDFSHKSDGEPLIAHPSQQCIQIGTGFLIEKLVISKRAAKRVDLPFKAVAPRQEISQPGSQERFVHSGDRRRDLLLCVNAAMNSYFAAYCWHLGQ